MSMHVPVASILMPVYNGGHYVAQAVRSILAQTFQDFEMIVIDDSSNDGAVTALDTLNDPRIKIHRNTHQCGIARSLNIGLARCQGRYIMRMDADDLSLPQRLQLQIDFLERNPTVGILGTNLVSLTSDDAQTAKAWFSPYRPQSVTWDLFFKNPLPHPTVAIRRSFLDRANLRYSEDSTCSRVEDLELWLRCAPLMRIERLDTVCLRLRLHEHSVSALARKQQAQQAEELALNAMGQLLASPLAATAARLLRREQLPQSIDSAIALAMLSLLHHLRIAAETWLPLSREQKHAIRYDVAIRVIKIMRTSAKRDKDIYREALAIFRDLGLGDIVRSPFEYIYSQRPLPQGTLD